MLNDWRRSLFSLFGISGICCCSNCFVLLSLVISYCVQDILLIICKHNSMLIILSSLSKDRCFLLPNSWEHYHYVIALIQFHIFIWRGFWTGIPCNGMLLSIPFLFLVWAPQIPTNWRGILQDHIHTWVDSQLQALSPLPPEVLKSDDKLPTPSIIFLVISKSPKWRAGQIGPIP